LLKTTSWFNIGLAALGASGSDWQMGGLICRNSDPISEEKNSTHVFSSNLLVLQDSPQVDATKTELQNPNMSVSSNEQALAKITTTFMHHTNF